MPRNSDNGRKEICYEKNWYLFYFCFVAYAFCYGMYQYAGATLPELSIGSKLGRITGNARLPPTIQNGSVVFVCKYKAENAEKINRNVNSTYDLNKNIVYRGRETNSKGCV